MAAVPDRLPHAEERDKKISDAMAEHALKHPGKPFVSFEYFPPKTPAAVKSLQERLGRMSKYGPLFVDFTWGAGGSTADLTLDLTLSARERWGLLPNMHLTCTNMPVDKVKNTLKRCQEEGITNIFALRGDPPAGEAHWEAVDGGFTCARDLVQYIRKEYGNYFCVGVAGYPEGHPNAITQVDTLDGLTESEKGRAGAIRDESGAIIGYNVCRDKDFEVEMEYLKSKVEAGADFIVTQMFFDVEVYFSFVEACRKKGITIPVLPGIICVSTVAGFKRMVGFCKTRVSQALWEEFTSLGPDDEDSARKIGIRLNTENCRKLLEGGVPGLHFYTLNLEKVLMGSLANLGVLPNGDGTINDAATTSSSSNGSATTSTSSMNGKHPEKEVITPPLPASS